MSLLSPGRLAVHNAKFLLSGKCHRFFWRAWAIRGSMVAGRGGTFLSSVAHGDTGLFSPNCRVVRGGDFRSLPDFPRSGILARLQLWGRLYMAGGRRLGDRRSYGSSEPRPTGGARPNASVLPGVLVGCRRILRFWRALRYLAREHVFRPCFSTHCSRSVLCGHFGRDTAARNEPIQVDRTASFVAVVR